MKKRLGFIAISLAIIFLALPLASCKGDIETPKGMKLASDETADFTLFVPEKWTVDLTGAAVGAYASKDDPSSVSMMAWGLEYSDSTLADWWDVNLAEIEKVFSDVEVVAESNALVDNLNAKKYTYTASLGENSYTIMQVACIRDVYVYLFTYTSTPDKFDSHLEEVDSMLTNLKIGK